ncbi:hypothetical protein [uncultured Gammaproteobacteria bacterium]|jgi:hypothetical protein|nr:hypothetical protein BROOK1789B_1668 [Bathymodiolus brooksi thiotrophic gill symbiont]CAC9542631.1 hypothetical protein [uncultured Gammaproteobacteria bacterium]CAB9543152.1 hypothetical protein BROOK1789C_730 [Bathymodiolus brooksi thiotrophic gill symbiont]CAC9558485.1 hypothetical protein [uncultured Gammaproteobacteria bacterium]CAC9568573.1 hypothetical protein [uncultured Gammaproteobacteria bacterium]
MKKIIIAKNVKKDQRIGAFQSKNSYGFVK